MITNPMSIDHYDETDYNPETIEFIQWREKISNTAKAVGKEVGFEDVVINVFGTWGYRDRIGTIRLWMNGCQIVHYWDDATVARFRHEDDEMLLRELLPQLVAEATKISAKLALKKEQERIEKAELEAAKAAKAAEQKAKAAQQMEQYRALSPEQIKADWLAKVAAAKAAQAAKEAESRKPKLRKR